MNSENATNAKGAATSSSKPINLGPMLVVEGPYLGAKVIPASPIYHRTIGKGIYLAELGYRHIPCVDLDDIGRNPGRKPRIIPVRGHHLRRIQESAQP